MTTDTQHRRLQSLLPLLTIAGCVALLFQQALDEVWAPAAHIAYTAFLLMVISFALFAWYPQATGRAAPKLIVILWGLLPLMLIVGAYVPSGWNLWNRALLLLNGVLLTAALVRVAGSPLRYSRLLTVLGTLALMIFFTYALDRAIGLATGGRAPGGLVFPRNSRVTYQTPEFEYTAKINHYGFRGKNFDLTKPVGCRVMLLGDSFTYGWGADYEQTWAFLLENRLQHSGIDAQVLNLGAPGANIPDYATIAEIAAPILQPDVVLVGVLQGDDMRQMSRGPVAFPREITFGDDQTQAPLTEYLVFHYPHIAERSILTHTPAANVRRNWQATAERFYGYYQTREEWLTRFNALDAQIQQDFFAGNINPHQVQFAVIMPDYWVWVLQDPDTLVPYQSDMANDFRQIAQAAPDADTVIVSVPYGAYTQPEARDDLAAMGFIMPPEIVESSLVDDAIEQAANTAGLSFIKATDAFRTHNQLAFYPIDGHFNVEGNRLFAEAIAPSVMELCADQ